MFSSISVFFINSYKFDDNSNALMIFLCFHLFFDFRYAQLIWVVASLTFQVLSRFWFLQFSHNDVFGFRWMKIYFSYLYSRPPNPLLRAPPQPPTHPPNHPPPPHLLHLRFRRVVALTTGSLMNLRFPGERAISAEVVKHLFNNLRRTRSLVM